MMKFCTFMDKLLNFCNSQLKVSFYRYYRKEGCSGFRILIIERRSDYRGEKISDEF